MTRQPALFTDAGVTRRAVSNAKREYRELMLARMPGPAGYVPPTPPSLNGEPRIILNAETSGLKWWHEDRPVGWSYWLPGSGRRGYLPIRHDVGPNLSVDIVRAWLCSLRGVHIDNINTKFDLHMARVDGCDLVNETGNTFGDVAHQAALLDDHRMRFNLDQLSRDILGWDVEQDAIGKIPIGITDESEFRFLHPGLVEPYAIRNVEQVHRLHDHFAPFIVEEQLEDVLALEREVLPAVVEMESNGTFLDVDLLHQWQVEVNEKLESITWQVYKNTGLQLTSFDSGKQLEKLFEKLNIPVTSFTDNGAASFTDNILATIDHPTVKDVRLGGHLADLKSKYLDKYDAAARSSDGWMRFNLHQLRVGKSEEDKKGTVSGRFSGAGDKSIKPDGFGSGGYNPQQVVAVEKQLERHWCEDYVVRKLFVPGSPSDRKENPYLKFLASDMMQVEYRLFAHYADIAATYHAEPKQKMIGGKLVWIAGPLADFHAMVAELLNNPRLNRKLVKNVNFAKIYGAGLVKFAFMTGFITEQEFKSLSERLNACGRDWRKRREILQGHPGVQAASEVNDEYMRMFPAVGPLLKLASETAETRGHVKTLMGRRARLVNRFHSALNRVVQGGAADINKRVVVEVYKHRKELELTLRLTVHDEMAGDSHNPTKLKRFQEIVDTQYFDLKAPILWETKTGDNWAECK